MTKTITTVSPILAALFVGNDAARFVVDTHQRDVLDVPAAADMSQDDRAKQVHENDVLLEGLCKVHYAVAHYPAENARDLKAKLDFMIQEQMGDGFDWLPTIMEDLERIEPTETPKWTDALEAYEEATANDLAAGKLLTAAEDAHEEDPQVAAVRGLVAAEAMKDEASNAQCAAIRALTNSPAPSLSALLVNMQIAIDTGMIANPDINDALKTDLRRFSHYADKEA